MIILLIRKVLKNYQIFNIFRYQIFLAGIGLLNSLFLVLLINPYYIKWLRKLNLNQIVRNFGPISHFNKSKTPTVGGVVIIFSIIISMILWTHLNNIYIWLILFTLVSYGTLGFIDDYYKIIYKNSMGIRCQWKYFWQSLLAILIVVIFFLLCDNTSTNYLVIPFFEKIISKFSIWYMFISYLTIVGTSNAVNITDGLDGLVIMPIVFISIGLLILSLITSNIDLASYFHIPYIHYAIDFVTVSAIISGAALGFLWFNAYPAKIFMGDTGSLSLGSTIGIMFVLIRQELLLIVMGGGFVIETISVILQVVSFKLRRKKIFLMTPIHHHFELKGYPEALITIRFWIISLILMLIGLTTLKI